MRTALLSTREAMNTDRANVPCRGIRFSRAMRSGLSLVILFGAWSFVVPARADSRKNLTNDFEWSGLDWGPQVEVMSLPLESTTFAKYVRSPSGPLVLRSLSGADMGLHRPTLVGGGFGGHILWGPLVLGALVRVAEGSLDGPPPTSGPGVASDATSLNTVLAGPDLGVRVDLRYLQVRATALCGYRTVSVASGESTAGFFAQGLARADYVIDFGDESSFGPLAIGAFAGLDVYPLGGIVGGVSFGHYLLKSQW